MSSTAVFHAALERPEPERAAFLDIECGQDAVLRKRVDALLDATLGPVCSWNSRRAEPEAESPARDRRTPDLTGSRVDRACVRRSGRHVHGGQSRQRCQPGRRRRRDRIGRYKLCQYRRRRLRRCLYGRAGEPIRRRVALKVIKLGMDSEVIARFEAERQALALMDHPNIAKVLDAGATETGRPYFVMELVKGVPITEYCDQHKLTPRERLELFIQVCQAIQHAHQKGIIHRDIKPSNILVTLHDGVPVPKVIDFGIAKATDQR